MGEETDFKALYEAMREENEKLRLKFWTEHMNTTSWGERIESVVEFMGENATVIVIGLLVIYYVSNLIIDIVQMIRGKS